jgi:hypothetical protein
MREVYPVKYYRDEGFVETKIEINEEGLPAIIEYYVRDHTDVDFDEIEVVNNRPVNVWLYAKCRKYVDPEDPEADLSVAEVIVAGPYDDNPTPS